MVSSSSLRKQKSSAAEAKSDQKLPGRKKIEKTKKPPNPQKEMPNKTLKKQRGDGGPPRRSSRLQVTPSAASVKQKPARTQIPPRSSNRKSSRILTPCAVGLTAPERVEKPEKVAHQQDPYYDTAPQLSQSEEEGSSSLSPGQRNRDIINDIVASVCPRLFGAGIRAVRDETIVSGGGIFASTPSSAAVYGDKMASEIGITPLKNLVLGDGQCSIPMEGSKANSTIASTPSLAAVNGDKVTSDIGTTALKNLLLGDGEPSIPVKESKVNSTTSALHLQSVEAENTPIGTVQVVAKGDAKGVPSAADSSGQCHSIGLTLMEAMCADEVDGLDEVDCPAFVTVSGYRVKESCAPTLRTIISKYGDIAANCTLKSSQNRSRALETVCECFHSFQAKKLYEVEPMAVGKTLDVLNDFRDVGLDVGWVCERLEQIVKAKQQVKQASEMKQARGRCGAVCKQERGKLKEIESGREVLKRMLEENESEMEEEERKLEEQRRKVDEKRRKKDELERQMMEGEEEFQRVKARAENADREAQRVQERIADALTTVRALATCGVMDGLL